MSNTIFYKKGTELACKMDLPEANQPRMGHLGEEHETQYHHLEALPGLSPSFAVEMVLTSFCLLQRNCKLKKARVLWREQFFLKLPIIRCHSLRLGYKLSLNTQKPLCPPPRLKYTHKQYTHKKKRHKIGWNLTSSSHSCSEYTVGQTL